TELNGVVTARGSYSHDAIRFKVRTSKATYPETAELYYYVKFGDVLRIGCDPDNDAFTELPVSIECTGDAKTCSELSSLN
ncbi:MAG: hypothetical protein ABIR96_01625, partial [Bdellovibrionota bacterium]